MKQMSRFIYAILFIGLSVAHTPVMAAKCDISQYDLAQLVQAEEDLAAKSTRENGERLLQLLPSRFCEFQSIYGFTEQGDDTSFGPLYARGLHSVFPRLLEVVPETELASEAQWQVDNVNALQSAFEELFEAHPQLVVGKIMDLPPQQSHTAIRFLYEGHEPPSQYFLSVPDRAPLCRESARFCTILKRVEAELVEEHKHH
jgi:hypothetical protein